MQQIAHDPLTELYKFGTDVVEKARKFPEVLRAMEILSGFKIEYHEDVSMAGPYGAMSHPSSYLITIGTKVDPDNLLASIVHEAAHVERALDFTSYSLMNKEDFVNYMLKEEVHAYTVQTEFEIKLLGRSTVNDINFHVYEKKHLDLGPYPEFYAKQWEALFSWKHNGQ